MWQCITHKRNIQSNFRQLKEVKCRHSKLKKRKSSLKKKTQLSQLLQQKCEGDNLALQGVAMHLVVIVQIQTYRGLINSMKKLLHKSL